MSQHSPIDRAGFRQAMSRVAASVHLVTTDGPAGRRGVTATSVCSVSDEPATLLICLNVSSLANERFAANGVLAVNTLGASGEGLARAFAGEGKLEPDERFARGLWTTLETGAPILQTALASFDCRIVDRRIVATHHVIVAEVAALRAGPEAASLLYRDRQYLAL